MSAAPPILAFKQIRKSFGAVRALRGVDFEVHAGEVHALLGENGAGKSTLIKVATGAHAPDGGVIELAGRAMDALTPAQARDSGIACIYQQPALFPTLSVTENIALRLESAPGWRRIDWPARRARAAALLSGVGAEISPETEVAELSMPEQQLVEIACAVGAGARIVIMDEPTASLTQREQERLYVIVRDLRRRGVAVIYISHRLEEIFALADRVTVLRDGQSVGTHEVGTIDETQLIRLMVGREIAELYPTMVAPGGDGSLPDGRSPQVAGADRVVGDAHDAAIPALAVRDLGVATLVTGVSLEVNRGEILGLAGLVGAGRTELARVLFGLTPAQTGVIEVNGVAAQIRTPRDAIRLGIAYVPEDRRRHGVILELPVMQNITLAVHRRLFPGGWLRPRAERRLTGEFVRRLGIKVDDVDLPAATLSGGNQQKVALARWLATGPRVLILDEPTQGVDVGAKSEIHRLIRQLANEGLAVILISSDLPEIIGMCDRIGVMRHGRLVTVLPGRSTAETVMTAALGRSDNAEGAA